MADWHELVGHIRSSYNVTDQSEGLLQLLMNTDDDRSQFVYVIRKEVMGSEWVAIESPIAKVASIDLEDALLFAGSLSCGGLATRNGVVVLRHALPLADLSADEFDDPFGLVTMSADLLEQHLIGGDRF